MSQNQTAVAITTPVRVTTATSWQTSAPAVPIPPCYFSWSVDGVQKDYLPAKDGVLTYHIPRIHKSIHEEFLKETIRTILNKMNGGCSCNVVRKVVFRPLPGCRKYKEAFIYHYPLGDGPLYNRENHYNSLAVSGAGVWSNSREYPYNMDLVGRMTKNIFMCEHLGTPVKLHFTYRGQPSYLTLLPNWQPENWLE
jgi:hypothetical protein